ncbi:hypothetical protein I0Q12_19565 [Rhodococcus sp. CX]|uniref:hypothetical protein n=1 Tax=Rhodococcus sp. CX TaxID=2789880 RepID=UPI0018CDF13E|nr:hypothetical protein [Rhodococcus sp. CX]MBH0121590.1 hypothetical protein [Rhodococcus sp. CX]
MTVTPHPSTVESVRQLDPKSAAAEANAYIDILPDVTSILAATAAGEHMLAHNHAQLLWGFLTARTAAIRAAHPGLDYEDAA